MMYDVWVYMGVHVLCALVAYMLCMRVVSEENEEQPGPAVAVFLLSVCVLFGPLTFMAALAAVVIKHFDKGGR